MTNLSSKLIDEHGNPLPVSVEVARLCQVVAGYEVLLCSVGCGTDENLKKYDRAVSKLMDRLDAESLAAGKPSRGE